MIIDDKIAIRKVLDEDIDEVNIYGLGDAHIGAPEHDEKAFAQKIELILDDPNGYCVICGDMGDFGLKNAKTNVYLARLQPMQQKEEIYNILRPLSEAGKILAIVPGNHENRLTKEVGTSPLYDIACRLRLEDCYRENAAFLQLFWGKYSKSRQFSSTGVITHGASMNKHKNFLGTIEGIDWAISGHTHQPAINQWGRLVVDKRGIITEKLVSNVVVEASTEPGKGYGLKNEYNIAPPAIIHGIKLRAKGHKKKIDTFTIQL